MKSKNSVTVIGGLTMDLTYFVNQWPEVGKAVQATSYKLTPGGKGFNQATAVSRLETQVNFIGSISTDGFSKQILHEVTKEGINTGNIVSYDTILTDLIGIIVNHSGTPGFIGIKSSTVKLSPQDVINKRRLISDSGVLLVNSEVSSDTVACALEIAKDAGIITIFNPAPPEPIPDKIFKLVDYFVPNIWEAQIISGSESMSASELAEYFMEKGAKNTCVTLGKDGCVVSTNEGTKSYIAFPVDEVDETGAGDAFCGCLAHSLSKDEGLENSIRVASAAGAAACLKTGGRSSPTTQELNDFLNKHKNIKL